MKSEQKITKIQFAGYIALLIAFISLVNSCSHEPETEKSGVLVKSSSYGENWPLNVSEARLDCDIPDIAYIEANGTRYALNGGALRKGFPRPDAIRKEAVSIFMADFTEKAMQICLDKRK